VYRLRRSILALHGATSERYSDDKLVEKKATKS